MVSWKYGKYALRQIFMVNMYCNATALLKIDPQVYVEACKYGDAESQQCSMLSGNDNDGYLEV